MGTTPVRAGISSLLQENAAANEVGPNSRNFRSRSNVNSSFRIFRTNADNAKKSTAKIYAVATAENANLKFEPVAVNIVAKNQLASVTITKIYFRRIIVYVLVRILPRNIP